MLGKVKDSEVRSVRIFVTVRSGVFFKVRSVCFVIRVAALPIQKVRPLKNGADNNYLPFQDHFCLKKGNYRG